MRLLALSILLAGCSLVANPDDHLGEDGSVQGDAGMDAGTDAAVDAGRDAGPDAGVDGSVDAGPGDAGPGCRSLLLTGGSAVAGADMAYDLQSFTIEAWLRPRENLGDRNVAGRWGQIGLGTGSYALFLRERAPAIAFSCVGDMYDELFVAPMRLTPDTWAHVAVTFDSGTSTARIFIDGTQVATETFMCAMPHLPAGIGITVGYDDLEPVSGSPFQGNIDELRVSNFARYGAGGFTTVRRPDSDVNTVLLYHFDDEDGLLIADTSGTDNDAMLLGAAGFENTCPP